MPYLSVSETEPSEVCQDSPCRRTVSTDISGHHERSIGELEGKKTLLTNIEHRKTGFSDVYNKTANIRRIH